MGPKSITPSLHIKYIVYTSITKEYTLPNRPASLGGAGWQYNGIICIQSFFPTWRSNGLSVECHFMVNIYSYSITKQGTIISSIYLNIFSQYDLIHLFYIHAYIWGPTKLKE